MASHMTITKPQSEALAKFIATHKPASIDKLVEKMGQDDAFRILAIEKRLPEVEDKG